MSGSSTRRHVGATGEFATKASAGPRGRAACATAEGPSQVGAQGRVCICTPFVLVKEIVLSSF